MMKASAPLRIARPVVSKARVSPSMSFRPVLPHCPPAFAASPALRRVPRLAPWGPVAPPPPRRPRAHRPSLRRLRSGGSHGSRRGVPSLPPPPRRPRAHRPLLRRLRSGGSHGSAPWGPVAPTSSAEASCPPAFAASPAPTARAVGTVAPRRIRWARAPCTSAAPACGVERRCGRCPRRPRRSACTGRRRCRGGRALARGTTPPP